MALLMIIQLTPKTRTSARFAGWGYNSRHTKGKTAYNRGKKSENLRGLQTAGRQLPRRLLLHTLSRLGSGNENPCNRASSAVVRRRTGGQSQSSKMAGVSVCTPAFPAVSPGFHHAAVTGRFPGIGGLLLSLSFYPKNPGHTRKLERAILYGPERSFSIPAGEPDPLFHPANLALAQV